MINYSQRNPQWSSLKINGTNSTMGSYGCFITSLAMMAEIRPDKCLEKLTSAGCFSGDLIIAKKAAQVLGLEVIESGDSKLVSPQPMELPCIMEVDFSPKEGKQTHFVVYKGDGVIVDSFDGQEKANPYAVTNYRNIFPKGTLDKIKELEEKDRKIKELNEVIELQKKNYDKNIEEVKDQPKQFEVKKAIQYTAENLIAIEGVLAALESVVGTQIDNKHELAMSFSALPQLIKFIKIMAGALYAKYKRQ